MPKHTRSARKAREPISVRMPDVSETVAPAHVSSRSFTKKLLNVRFILPVLVLLGVGLFLLGRSYVIVAYVNGQPISRFELNDLMTKRFGAQTLDGIINERLILAGTRQKGVFVTNSEIDAKVTEISDRLKDTISLKDALSAQGLTEDMFRRQVEIQLAIDKMFDAESSVSSQEIDNYIATNSSSFAGLGTEEVRTQVQEMLRSQKMNELFESWFNQIRESAKVQKNI